MSSVWTTATSASTPAALNESPEHSDNCLSANGEKCPDQKSKETQREQHTELKAASCQQINIVNSNNKSNCSNIKSTSSSGYNSLASGIYNSHSIGSLAHNNNSSSNNNEKSLHGSSSISGISSASSSGGTSSTTKQHSTHHNFLQQQQQHHHHPHSHQQLQLNVGSNSNSGTSGGHSNHGNSANGTATYHHRNSISHSLAQQQYPPPPPPPLSAVYKHRRTIGSMSQAGDDLHSPNHLSWRKLQLSRAKLKASSKTSALLSGFAMVAMVEVQLNDNTKVPDPMLVTFAICTTLLVAVHMLALMISTCILPNIETVCNLHSISLVHESPHERLHWYIEIAWAFSTLLGLILFLLEIAILCWVKFYDLSKPAAWSACIVLIPVLVVFLAFAIHFYRSLVTHKYEVTVSGIRELEILKEQMEHEHLDQHTHQMGGGMGGQSHRNNGINYGASGDIV